MQTCMEACNMITFIKNGEVYTPYPLGRTSVLLIHDKIAKIGELDEIALASFGLYYSVVDADGAVVVSGFIVPHVNINGGGGDGDFDTRTSEIQLSDLIHSCITKVVGLLGTDGTIRH